MSHYDGLIQVLLYCTLTNYAVLLLWTGMYFFARDWMYRLHTRMFDVPLTTFHMVNYGGIAAYKVAIFVFNVAPLIALWCVSAT